jgi:hypothetical protein
LIFAIGIDWEITVSVLTIILLGMILAYRLLHRDPGVKRTRWGFYVERDRFDEDENEWPEPLHSPHTALPNWHETTVELPPEKEEK